VPPRQGRAGEGTRPRLAPVAVRGIGTVQASFSFAVLRSRHPSMMIPRKRNEAS
jgi:hypothetical protein